MQHCLAIVPQLFWNSPETESLNCMDTIFLNKVFRSRAQTETTEPCVCALVSHIMTNSSTPNGWSCDFIQHFYSHSHSLSFNYQNSLLELQVCIGISYLFLKESIFWIYELVHINNEH
jgi:hypothetical protein